MGRMKLVLSAAGIVALTTTAGSSSALAQQAGGRAPEVRTVNAVIGGVIKGIVSDELGGPLPGAMVSALGATMAMTVTDAHGRFSLEKLPAGDYTLRAHLAGFAASRRETVRVGVTPASVYRLQLHRLETAVATTGNTNEVTARPILAAGFGLPSITSTSTDSTEGDDEHSHTDTAWRLRHLTRSILKDSTSIVVLEQDDTPAADDPMVGHLNQSAASALGSFFADLPFKGEVNLLTTSAFAPGRFFSGDILPRGVAYFAIGAPTGLGDWSVRGAMSEGDLSSWIVSGSFLSKRDGIHSYDLGLTYSTQDYQGGNPLALAAVSDGNRNVGEIYALDRWTVGTGVSVEYGGRYARYDYLAQPGLFSPRVGLSLEPSSTTRVTAVLAQRMIAPGAEEFLTPATAGPWLPPERTFSPLSGGELRVERARDLDVFVEHDFGIYSLGVHRFFQGVDNQAMTIFGMRSPDGTRSVGHYYVAGAGSVDVTGWGVRLSSAASRRVSGSVDYTFSHGRWNSFGEISQGRPWLANLVREQDEDIHDLTTSVQTAIPETATRVFVLYKLNSAYARRSLASTEPGGAGLDGRFDVQVNQALPFGLGSTKWEVLVGVRNLFRDPNDPASIYDELLVVRPPKRVVGGFLVRF
jgi:Carboxypeptidase regulatory-like domain/TonB dependent receptor-like, beta-barrel